MYATNGGNLISQSATKNCATDGRGLLLYAYDPLNRLTEMQRGVLNGTKTAITGTPSVEPDWTLDPTGNWSNFTTKATGSTTLAQTSTANTVNEITNITEATGPTWVVPAYDLAGNTTTMPQVTDPTQSFTATYDARNRMTSISASGSTVAQYQYDGRNFRIVKQVLGHRSRDEALLLHRRLAGRRGAGGHRHHDGQAVRVGGAVHRRAGVPG